MSRPAITATYFRPAIHPSLTIGGDKSIVHQAALWLVALTVLSGAFVFAEPAPVDVLTMGLIVGLPVVGLTYFNDRLKVFSAVLLVLGGCQIMSVMISENTGESLMHVVISLYLLAGAAVFAAFVARRPNDHASLILAAYTGAAVIAVVAAIAGYFALVPGAEELFTKYGRASGPFKDPNVFGAFLIPAILYVLHGALTRRGSGAVVMTIALSLFALAALLSFSRGAWAAALIAVISYLALAFLTAKQHRLQVKIVALLLIGGIFAALALVGVAQTDAVGNLLAERAQLTQTYDTGHEGRFGGQWKALDVIASNPFGIGALEFAKFYHSEEVHNVYLTMFLNAGWLGGGLFIVLALATIIFGLRHAFRRTASQPVFIIAFAALLAILLEGLLIDIDHWRHFYLLMAVVWGLMLTDRAIQRRPRIVADISEQRMQLAGIPCAPHREGKPLRPSRIQSDTANQTVLYDVRGYSAYATRRPRIIRARH